MAFKQGIFPFSVDRTLKQTLVEQVSANMRQAILCGDWPFGVRVPSLRDAVRDLKVSYKVACRAYESLCREGWLRSSSRRGYTAAAPDVPRWRGEVLCICGDSYADMEKMMVIQHELAHTGWLCTSVFHRYGEQDAAEGWILDVMLTRRFDLVLVFNPSDDVLSRIQYAEKPYVELTSCRPVFRRHCRGIVALRMESAIRELAAECRRLRVGTAWCVNFQPVYGYVGKALRDAGVSAKTVITGVDAGAPEVRDSVRERAYSWFDAYVKSGRAFPDLIVMLDDYVASGALASLSYAGVRIPEDVQLVTFVNSGNGLSYARSLARLENDIRQNGIRIAKYLTECLNSAHRRPALELDAYVYKPGDTFSRVAT